MAADTTMVSTLDFESSNPNSNLGGTSMLSVDVLLYPQFVESRGPIFDLVLGPELASATYWR